MSPITYKQVLDKEGSLVGLELHQDGRYIEISLGAKAQHYGGFRWYEIKKVIDELQQRAFKDAGGIDE